MTTATKLPQQDRPVRMDPELQAAVEKILKPYKGEDLRRAQKAVQRVYGSGLSGSFHEIVAAYREAVTEAVSGD